MVSGFAIATLVVFILSIVFVIRPLTIPIPSRYAVKGVKGIRIDLLSAPIAAIAILWAAQCLGASTIRDGIVGTEGVKPYNILILFFSLAYMSITLDTTGVLEAAAYWVSNKSGTNGWLLFINFYIMVTVLSAVLGNDPVILSGTLFLIYYTNATKLDQLPWLMSEFAAANTASMVLFVGNPTNVVICEGFSIQNAAFTAYTILPFLACSVTCLAVLFAQYHLSGKLVRVLPKTEQLNVRAALRDPIGALIGSILLGSCLVVALVVSFVHVDVWKITLPFAGTKFLFDLFWDHYRFVQGRKSLQWELEKSIGPMRSDTDDSSPGSLESSLTIKPPQTHPEDLPTEDTNPVPEGWRRSVSVRFPTIYKAFPRLPFALVPFAFSQFILIEALARQGWINIFARWLVIASNKQLFPVLWLVGFLGVVLCNISGTNIGATILLTKVVRAAQLSGPSNRAAGIALAVASNIGAVSFVFSASLAGLLWKQIIDHHKPDNKITQRMFAKWNMIPLLVMTTVGLGVVSAEMAILYH
ncbi:hypothetical protein AX17_006871 [Amanita inopinata Kibby_2008]|nr:hypothetical protein AX17_006871 [Amanita inopinata Kibby_2008]